MAYLAFQELGGVVVDRAAPARPVGFSALQWSVVTLARRDPLWSIRAPSRWRRLARAALGGRSPMLADTALEALRRVAVLAWHGRDAQAGRDWAGFVAAGFGLRHYQLLLTRVADAVR